MKSFHRPEKKIWNYIKTCGRNLFCVHESCNIWGAISCVWHSSLKTGALLAPSPVICFSVLNPHSCRYHIHTASLSPKGNSPGCFLLSLCPSDCPLPLGWWKHELLPFPKENKCAAVRGSVSRSSEPGPAGSLSAHNPNTGQGCAGCNKPLQGCKTGQRSQRVQLCLDND